MSTLHPWQFLLITFAGWINRHQQDVIDYLLDENQVLKGQLRGRRLRLSDDERRRLALKGKALGRSVLEKVSTIVTPDTIMAVPTELVFDQGFGDLFVVRNAGHVMTTDVLGSIEYALVHLHVHLVVIMGHEGCGAVTAALDAKDRDKEPIELQEVLRMIDPALRNVSRTGDDEKRVAAAVEANVRYSVRQVTELAAERGKARELDVRFVGAVYGLKTGAVSFLK